MRKHSPLPEGYSVEKATSLRLFNAQGTLVDALPDSPAASTIVEARAWEDTWHNVERELREDLRALREGTRPLEDLRRLRQYMRMLDTIERAPAEAQEQEAHARVVRRRAFGGLALAAAAAAIAVFVTSAPVKLADNVQKSPPSRPGAATPSATGSGTEQAAPRLAEPATPSAVIRKAGTGVVQQPSLSTPRPPSGARSVAAAARTPLTGYAVSFGEFATRTTADARMRLIRAKGYLVYVAQVGDSYLVVTRPYRTREQAERLTNALQEIGLPATTQIAGTFLL